MVFEYFLDDDETWCVRKKGPFSFCSMYNFHFEYEYDAIEFKKLLEKTIESRIYDESC